MMLRGVGWESWITRWVGVLDHTVTEPGLSIRIRAVMWVHLFGFAAALAIMLTARLLLIIRVVSLLLVWACLPFLVRRCGIWALRAALAVVVAWGGTGCLLHLTTVAYKDLNCSQREAWEQTWMKAGDMPTWVVGGWPIWGVEGDDPVTNALLNPPMIIGGSRYRDPCWGLYGDKGVVAYVANWTILWLMVMAALAVVGRWRAPGRVSLVRPWCVASALWALGTHLEFEWFREYGWW